MGIADFIIPKRQQRLLAALLLHPERTYSYNELLRIGGSGRGANQTALKAILESGLARSEKLGNQRRIRANPDFPIYAELRAICLKTFGVQDLLQKAFEPLKKKIDFAFVFGSMVTGQERADSDIDLLVVGSVDLLELNAALGPVEQELGREIHVTLYDSDEWSTKRLNSGIQRILQSPKLMVIHADRTPGGDEEFAGPGPLEGSGPR